MTILIDNRRGQPIYEQIVEAVKHQILSGELAEKIGISASNLSILKTGKAKAIRFTTLASLCKALECQPGDLLEYQEDD